MKRVVVICSVSLLFGLVFAIETNCLAQVATNTNAPVVSTRIIKFRAPDRFNIHALQRPISASPTIGATNELKFGPVSGGLRLGAAFKMVTNDSRPKIEVIAVIQNQSAENKWWWEYAVNYPWQSFHPLCFEIKNKEQKTILKTARADITLDGHFRSPFGYVLLPGHQVRFRVQIELSAEFENEGEYQASVNAFFTRSEKQQEAQIVAPPTTLRISSNTVMALRNTPRTNRYTYNILEPLLGPEHLPFIRTNL